MNLKVNYLNVNYLMITFIRHAPSTFNEHGDLTPNCPITENGAKLAKNITGKYDLVICSTLKRARQTLDESGIIYSNILFTDLCREFRQGNTSDMFNGESDMLSFETNDMMNKRIDEFKSLLKDYNKKYQNIAVISHHGFLHRLSGVSLKNCQQVLYELK